jgi:hypothetical protein
MAHEHQGIVVERPNVNTGIVSKALPLMDVVAYGSWPFI